MENWIQDVISKWKSEGIKLNPPATIVEIENTETILGFKFPADFKDFYLKINGFDEWDMLDNCFSIWPLDRILEEHVDWKEDNFIGVCDYLIRAHAIGFNRKKPGFFKLKDTLDNSGYVAATFTELIALIANDDCLLY